MNNTTLALEQQVALTLAMVQVAMWVLLGLFLSVAVFWVVVFLVRWYRGELKDENKNGVPDSLEKVLAATQKSISLLEQLTLSNQNDKALAVAEKLLKQQIKENSD